MKSRKKKPWLAWLAGIALCMVVPCALIGKSIWNDFRATVGSNKALIATTINNHYDGKKIDEMILDPTAAKQVNTVFMEIDTAMGKLVSIGSPDTIPSVSDAISKGWELSYNVPVQYKNGYKTLTIRIRNEGLNQKIVSMLASDGILPKDDVKKRLKQSLP